MSCVFLEGKDFCPYPFSALIRFSMLGCFFLVMINPLNRCISNGKGRH
jgi:hypothetical protein